MSFNSQPPEGGWRYQAMKPTIMISFQLTAARRRLDQPACRLNRASAFQLTAARRRLVRFRFRPKSRKSFQLTAARRRLAIAACSGLYSPLFQLTAARRRLVNRGLLRAVFAIVSTHSRPKAAGDGFACGKPLHTFQLTAARRRLAFMKKAVNSVTKFQLTAARRRLAQTAWRSNRRQ